MASRQFSQWIKQGSQAERERFVCVLLKVSRQVWENTFLPQCKARFQTDRVVRISTADDWEEKRPDLCQPTLFAHNVLLILDEVGEKLAVEIRQESRLSRGTTILYLRRELPGKNWQSVPLVEVALSEQRLREELVERWGRTIQPKAMQLLSRLWREFNLGPEDIEQWVIQTDPQRPIQVQDVESHFEKSEKVLLFGLLDAVSEKRIADAQRSFAGLMKLDYPPTLLMSHLARRYRLILQALETSEKEKDLWKGTKVSPFEFSKIKKAAGHYDSQQVSAVFRVLSRIDRESKSQGIPFEILMLDFFTTLME